MVNFWVMGIIFGVPAVLGLFAWSWWVCLADNTGMADTSSAGRHSRFFKSFSSADLSSCFLRNTFHFNKNYRCIALA